MAKTVNGKVLVALVREHSSMRSDVAELTGDFGERIKGAIESKGLHRQVFSLITKLNKMELPKRLEFERQFGLYCDLMYEQGEWTKPTGDLMEGSNSEAAGVGPIEDGEGHEGEPAADRGDGAGFEAAAPAESAPKKGRGGKKASDTEIGRRKVAAAEAGRDDLADDKRGPAGETIEQRRERYKKERAEGVVSAEADDAPPPGIGDDEAARAGYTLQ